MLACPQRRVLASTLLLATAALVAGCAKEPMARTCSSKAECTSYESCVLGVCQEDVTVTLVSPAQPVVTRSTVAVEVAIAGLAPPVVEVQVDGVTVATLDAAPFTTTLSTAALVEGAHALTAVVRLGGRAFSSVAVSLTVDRTAPAAPGLSASALTNADPVPVGGTAEGGALVRVYDGVTLVGSTTASGGGAWSRPLALAPGTHPLSATAEDAAGNVSGASVTQQVIVDRAAPSVTGFTPVNAATTVWSRSPVVVTFSEAIRADTLTGQSVKVSGTGFDVAFTPFQLSQDGRTLTLTPDPALLPPVPGTVVGTLSPAGNEIRDLAGNALPTTTWSWYLPDWLVAAPPAYGGYYMVLHGTGISDGGVLFDATNDGPSGLYARQQPASGTTWTDLGQVSTSTSGIRSSLAVDSLDRPVVANVESSAVHVRRLEGTSWVDLGLPTTTTGTRPLVAIDGQDRPVVLWRDSGTGTVYASRYAGGAWSSVVSKTASTSATAPYALAIKSDDTPVAAFVNAGGNVAASDVTLASGQQAASGLSVTQGGDGNDFVAYVASGTVGVLTVLNAYPAASLTPFGSTLANGSAPSILYRNVGPTDRRLLLGFKSTSPVYPAVYAWSGSQWTSITGSLATAAAGMVGDAELLTTPSGVVVCAWWEQRNADWRVLVTRKYNR